MKHVFGLFFSPHMAWEHIREQEDTVLLTYLKFVIPIALIPSIAWYFGSVGNRLAVGRSRHQADVRERDTDHGAVLPRHAYRHRGAWCHGALDVGNL